MCVTNARYILTKTRHSQLDFLLKLSTLLKANDVKYTENS